MQFNPLDHPILFAKPERLTPHSFWYEHIPFAMLMVDLLAPRVLVELGSHYGESYCAFCQAVAQLKTATKCFAVDSWVGDLHYGEYGSEVIDDLRAHHDPRYASFSTLVKKVFDDAVHDFADGSIDLLHIDGTHTYEAVKHDFETWLPKMSRRGVILFHDTNVRTGVFGVRRFFDETKPPYPNFEFLHCYGLGVLAVGDEVPERVRWLFDLTPTEIDRVRLLFETLGQLVRWQATNQEELQAKLTQQDAMLGEQTRFINQLEATIAEQLRLLHAGNLPASQPEPVATVKTNQSLEEAQAEARALRQQLQQITSGTGWRMLQKFWRVRAALNGTTRSSNGR